MASIDSSIFEISTHISMARCCTRLTEFRDPTSSVMLAMPVWRFVVPHLSCHIVPPSQFIGTVVSVCNEDKTTNSAECFPFPLKNS